MTGAENLYPYSKRLNILYQVGRIKVVRLGAFGKPRKQGFNFKCFIHNSSLPQIQDADIVDHNIGLFHFNSHLIQEVIISL
jgi:hypothetical protein